MFYNENHVVVFGGHAFALCAQKGTKRVEKFYHNLDTKIGIYKMIKLDF